MLKILVTGATGNVGREVINLLSNHNCDIYAAVRNPETARATFNSSGGRHINCIEFDFTKPSTFASAFEGVNKLFLVRPPALANVRKQVAPALETALAAGVEHIVFLSLLGAERNRIVPHAKIEQYINKLNIPATFLRAGFFMQNLSTVHRDEIRRGELFIPAGNGKTSFIDVRDIAAVAARALLEDGHSGKAYALTGNEALTYYEVAEIFTSVLDKPIRYTNPSIFKFIRMRAQELPIDFVLVMAGIYTTTRLGLAGSITGDVKLLLNRPPITVQKFVEDYRHLWV
ncbi:NmrA family protein [Calothrix sp. NIES-4071]|nr:NmrA family protein [Calothrix sp. NIES-4071]BAZ60516.1 NmrA family protein [Calothrix sp. NIES-4105]